MTTFQQFLATKDHVLDFMNLNNLELKDCSIQGCTLYYSSDKKFPDYYTDIYYYEELRKNNG